jgi:hypothetical protein
VRQVEDVKSSSVVADILCISQLMKRSSKFLYVTAALQAAYVRAIQLLFSKDG